MPRSESLIIYLSPEVRAKIKKLAKADGRSDSRYAGRIIEEAVAKKE